MENEAMRCAIRSAWPSHALSHENINILLYGEYSHKKPLWHSRWVRTMCICRSFNHTIIYGPLFYQLKSDTFHIFSVGAQQFLGSTRLAKKMNLIKTPSTTTAMAHADAMCGKISMWNMRAYTKFDLYPAFLYRFFFCVIYCTEYNIILNNKITRIATVFLYRILYKYL